MSKCLNLSRLPKLPTTNRVNLKRVRRSPGTFESLLFPGARHNRALTVDPSHPAHAVQRGKFRTFPRYDCSAYSARALPDALLMRRSAEPMRDEDKFLRDVTERRREKMARKERESREARGKKASLLGEDGQEGGREEGRFKFGVDHADAKESTNEGRGEGRTFRICIQFLTSKKATRKSAVIRGRLQTKFRSAVALVIQRGAVPVDARTGVALLDDASPPIALLAEKAAGTADTEGDEDGTAAGKKSDERKLALAFDPSQAGYMAPDVPWSLEGWTYVVWPRLEIYCMPTAQLVQHIRAGLRSMRAQASKFERAWHTGQRPDQARLITALKALVETRMGEEERIAKAAAPTPAAASRTDADGLPKYDPPLKPVGERLFEKKPVILRGPAVSTSSSSRLSPRAKSESTSR